MPPECIIMHFGFGWVFFFNEDQCVFYSEYANLLVVCHEYVSPHVISTGIYIETIEEIVVKAEIEIILNTAWKKSFTNAPSELP